MSAEDACDVAVVNAGAAVPDEEATCPSGDYDEDDVVDDADEDAGVVVVPIR